MTAKTETATLRIERTMKAPAERIYRAYLDRTKATAFFAFDPALVEYDRLEPKVGGLFRYTMRQPGGGWSQAYTGKFLELTEFTRIRHTYAFETDMPAMKTPMEIRLILAEGKGGTKVTFEQYGIPAPIPVDKATAGWKQGIERFVRIVESGA